jgi:hypothetical protein
VVAYRNRRADANIPNAKPGWALLSGDIKIARSTNANENPIGTVPPGETFLPGDIKYESPNGNVRIYFPIVTAIVLSVLFTLILRFIGTDRTSMSVVGGKAVEDDGDHVVAPTRLLQNFQGNAITAPPDLWRATAA